MHHLIRRLACAAIIIPFILILVQEVRAGELVVAADDWSAWEQRARSGLSPPQTLVVQDLVLDPTPAGRTISMERVEPFASGSRMRINGEWVDSAPSSRVYYRGSLVDELGSIVTLSIGDLGDFRGLLSGAQGYWMFTGTDSSSRQPARLLAVHQADAPESRGFNDGHEHGFQCQLDGHVRDISMSFLDAKISEAPPPQPRLGRNTDRYRVQVAFETDFSFYQLFLNSPNPEQAARNYLADLVNYISGIYINDLNTELEISSVSLWTAEADQPWQNIGSVGCLLNEMGIYWNNPQNNVDPDRTLAHFVTGPSTTDGGVAWLGVLCSGPEDVDTTPQEGPPCNGFTGIQNAFGDYGVSGDLTGTFDANTQPTVWDYVVVAHELGHNFQSDHTHCYQPVIDQCWAGEGNPNDPTNTCWTGAQTLPGPAGEGSGTIMSYCHLLNPGLSNIAPTLGLGHLFGDQPQRVPGVMRTHVLDRADPNNPRCPQLVATGPSLLVSTNVQGNGTVNPTSANVTQGDTAGFTLTPAAGANVISADGCGGNLAGNNIFTTGPINAPCTVNIVFSDTPAPDPLCAVVNMAIPDDNPQGISSTLTVANAGNIDKLEVLLDIEHTWVGDLIIDLRHEPSDTSVRLVNRPDGGGCSGDDIKVTLDDQAGLSIQDDCQADPDPAFPQERYRPANPLSAYNGLAISGDWTLTVSDNAAFDTGQLLRWCLVPTTSGVQIEIFADRFQQP